MSQKPSLDYRFDDRVAVQYDALRGHPASVSSAIGVSIAEQAGPGASILELGVGTGRIALPILAAGCELTGVDLSANMLATLARRGVQGLSLVRGDITQLPFAHNSFDAALCVHVLHLVDSKAVLAEILRLVRPNGVIILGRDWVAPDSFVGMIRNEFRQAVVELAESVDFPTGARGHAQQLIDLGAQPLFAGAEQTAVAWQTQLSVSQVLDGMRSKDDAESWVLPAPLLAKVMARLDAFAVSHWDDLHKPRPVQRRFVYSLFHAPKG